MTVELWWNVLLVAMLVSRVLLRKFIDARSIFIHFLCQLSSFGELTKKKNMTGSCPEFQVIAWCNEWMTPAPHADCVDNTRNQPHAYWSRFFFCKFFSQNFVCFLFCCSCSSYLFIKQRYISILFTWEDLLYCTQQITNYNSPMPSI